MLIVGYRGGVCRSMKRLWKSWKFEVQHKAPWNSSGSRSLTGQDAVNAAKGIWWAVGNRWNHHDENGWGSRGGAALSAKEVTGKPVKFIGMGEKMDALEQFHPERGRAEFWVWEICYLSSNRREAVYDEEQAAKLEKKPRKNQFTSGEIFGTDGTD